MNIGGCVAAHNYYVISMVLCGYYDIELVLGGFHYFILGNDSDRCGWC